MYKGFMIRRDRVWNTIIRPYLFLVFIILVGNQNHSNDVYKKYFFKNKCNFLLIFVHIKYQHINFLKSLHPLVYDNIPDRKHKYLNFEEQAQIKILKQATENGRAMPSSLIWIRPTLIPMAIRNREPTTPWGTTHLSHLMASPEIF